MKKKIAGDGRWVGKGPEGNAGVLCICVSLKTTAAGLTTVYYSAQMAGLDLSDNFFDRHF
jgi:hypothetical protein